MLHLEPVPGLGLGDQHGLFRQGRGKGGEVQAHTKPSYKDP